MQALVQLLSPGSLSDPSWPSQATSLGSGQSLAKVEPVNVTDVGHVTHPCP